MCTLPNTNSIDEEFGVFDAPQTALDEIPIFIAKCFRPFATI
jgi:hypothetical protein